MNSAIAAKLQSVEWDFEESSTRNGADNIHPYPARFIPQIPRHLIDLFCTPGATVLDPFCGSGTTLIEAFNAGIDSVGIDLHPLATLIAKVRTSVVSSDFLVTLNSVIANAKDRVHNRRVTIPEIPRIDHWFAPPIQLVLAALIEEINGLHAGEIADALKVAFSSIVVRVSFQDSDTRYAAVDNKITPKDVLTYFEKAAKKIYLTTSEESHPGSENTPKVNIITRDILDVQPDEIGGSIGLVITSPPYPNAYEYWLYHKYRMYWLGMNPISVREKEIGSRSHYFKKNFQTEIDFENQMRHCFWLISKVMMANAHACFVVGRSIIHGRYIDNEALLERAAAPHGFRKVGSVGRTIASNRKSFNLVHGKIKEERILVFTLEKN